MKEFWVNVGRYMRYFLTVTLGVFFVLFERFIPLFKRPATAIALVSLLVSSLVFVGFTLQAMLGLNAPINP